MRCIDVMKADVQTITLGDTIQHAAEKMALGNIGFLPVCAPTGTVIGTITDRDITIRAVATNRAPDTCQVGEVMTREVVACRPEDDLDTAEALMARHQKSRLLITDEQGVLAGVLSLSDIIEKDRGRRAVRTLRDVAAREAPRG